MVVHEVGLSYERYLQNNWLATTGFGQSWGYEHLARLNVGIKKKFKKRDLSIDTQSPYRSFYGALDIGIVTDGFLKIRSGYTPTAMFRYGYYFETKKKTVIQIALGNGHK